MQGKLGLKRPKGFVSFYCFVDCYFFVPITLKTGVLQDLGVIGSKGFAYYEKSRL
jgi:hypothetical protein